MNRQPCWEVIFITYWMIATLEKRLYTMNRQLCWKIIFLTYWILDNCYNNKTTNYSIRPSGVPFRVAQAQAIHEPAN